MRRRASSWLSPLLLIAALAVTATTAAAPTVPSALSADEHLGSVTFSVSCSKAVRAEFNRGVALLHNFWYTEAQPQFERIVAEDPTCAMAHWGIAMSVFHQIWDRPDENALQVGWREMQTSLALSTKSERERKYIEALSNFYRPDGRAYSQRIEAYSSALGALYRRYPRDVDAGAFYALSLLAAESPDDLSLTAERQAMTVLNPLFKRYPDHPGVVHYIIHACDTPALAVDGLAAARRYGRIASSGPHAVHMPGHIFARLGMWQEDIDSNVASVAASAAAETRHESGAMDQFHSDDFLLYAYLQSGEDDRASELMSASSAMLDHFEQMPNMADRYMTGMFPHFRTEYPVIFALEMRDWQSASALEPIANATPETRTQTYWARAIADGHLRHGQAASNDIAAYDALMAEVRNGRHAYFADSTGAKIARGEMLAWSAFAEADIPEAVNLMRGSAELQDRVGQGEVDIPAREMLADILLESGRFQEALAEYQRALILSPNRFNALYNAGMAAEKSGDASQATQYYSTLLKSTDNRTHSVRPELDHAKGFVAATKVAIN